jgi:cystathionine gamma-synthase
MTEDLPGGHDWHATEFATRAIHLGQDPDPVTGSVVPALHMSTTYKQDGVGNLRGGFEYSRSGNPTRAILEQCLAGLEAPGDPNVRAFSFASGLAASDAVLRSLLVPGDHLIVPHDAYGGTYRLIDAVAGPWGVDHTVVNMRDLDDVTAAIRPGRTKLMWVETPTNPLLSIADIAAVADIAHQSGVLLLVDNTFATPYLQRPLLLGADLVVHSVTKYLGGHSDVVGGAVVANGLQIAERIEYHQNAMGSVPSPFDCWLALRGIRTLGVRMDRHCSNAQDVVELLVEHPGVLEVFYPGLPTHPNHGIAAGQMKDFGGMVSFRPRGGVDAALAICAGTQVFTLGESLGGVESLIELPARMTHSSVSESELAVPEDLIRLSVGIEDTSDILQDLRRALSAVG